MSGGVAYVWNKAGDFDYYCNMEMVELSLIEDSATRKELHELIRKHYHYTGSHLDTIFDRPITCLLSMYGEECSWICHCCFDFKSEK